MRKNAERYIMLTEAIMKDSGKTIIEMAVEPVIM